MRATIIDIIADANMQRPNITVLIYSILNDAGLSRVIGCPVLANC